jgi:threonine/homoserine/homoserine lactone efflux protein
MNESVYWFLFISTAIILNISPGPDLIYLISKTMSYGKRTGFATMLGFGTGAMIHTLFVSLGISVIISKSILVFTIIKYIGAIYLFYLGIKTILSRDLNHFGAQNKYKSESFLKSYVQAIIIDITNPKVAIFFIALLPQFYRNNGSSQLIQFMTLGVIIVLIGFIVESLVIILLDKIIKQIKQKPNISYVIDKVFGGILIALGIRLIFDKK